MMTNNEFTTDFASKLVFAEYNVNFKVALTFRWKDQDIAGAYVDKPILYFADVFNEKGLIARHNNKTCPKLIQDAIFEEVQANVKPLLEKFGFVKKKKSLREVK